jgi:hypothetical protein
MGWVRFLVVNFPFPALVLGLYDQMRLAIERCAEIDEAAAIRDKGAQLEAYACIRNDDAWERKLAEIRLRAIRKIGELSRELEKKERARTNLHPNDREQTKAESLKQAGIPLSTAHDYEKTSTTGGQCGDSPSG